MQRKQEEALAIVAQALVLTPLDPELLLFSAELQAESGNKPQAIADLKSLLQLRSVSGFDLVIAIRLLRELTPDFVYLLQSAPALEEVDGEIELARELLASPETVRIAERLLKTWLDESEVDEYAIYLELQLCLISLGKFEEAKTLIEQASKRETQLGISDYFNLAMAEWSLSGSLPKPLLAKVVDMSKSMPGATSPNFWQCIAIAQWAIGLTQDALISLHRSGAAMAASRQWSFSAWSYLSVAPERFLSEIERMRLMFSGVPILPDFLTRAHGRS